MSTIPNPNVETKTIPDVPVRSWSQFSLYMKCPQLFKYQYIDRVVPRKESIALKIGNALHEGHEYLSGKKIETGEVIEFKYLKSFVEKYWEANPLKDSDSNLSEDLLEKNNALRYMETYYNFFKANEITPKHTEKDVIWHPPGASFAIRGIIDRIDQENTLVDLKTTGKSPPKSRKTGNIYIPKQSGYDIQLDIYAILMREALDIDVSGAYLEYVVKSKNCKVVKVKHEIREDRLKSAMQLMENIEENIQKGVFTKNRLSQYCGDYCSMWEQCTGIQTLEV